MVSFQAITNKLLLLLLIVYLLAGCSKEIDAKEAEDIAIQTATTEGYNNPRLFTKYNTKTEQVYQFSKKENKDVKTWQVTLITDEREYVEGMLGDIIYYIDIRSGDIVSKISGVD
ncbi:hypothetical protein [Bacillus alkalisoli]|uniref:hypothetical protein n=1 Tax=Bacillus alkalisoli TaxID=2011008 RepID=UPI000C246CBF|nr:hypothetical protein [Bacillus alkalisoli]